MVRGRHLCLQKKYTHKKGLKRKVKERKSDQKTTEVVFLRKDERNSPYLWMYFKTGLKETAPLLPDLANIHVLMCKQQLNCLARSRPEYMQWINLSKRLSWKGNIPEADTNYFGYMRNKNHALEIGIWNNWMNLWRRKCHLNFGNCSPLVRSDRL